MASRKIRMVTEVAQTLEIAKSEWNRTVQKVEVLFRYWRKAYPNSSKLEWIRYSGMNGLDEIAAKYVWNKYQLVKNEE